MKASGIHFKKSSPPVCFQIQKEFFHENKKRFFILLAEIELHAASFSVRYPPYRHL